MMNTSDYEIFSCEAAPDRAEMDAFLTAYYSLMMRRLRSMGAVADAASERAIQGFWDELAASLPPVGRLFLARDASGLLIGMGSLKAIDKTRAELKRLFVDASARGQGLGQRLIELRVEAARELGFKTLLIDTFKANIEMRGLYAKLGFEEIDFFPESTTYRDAPELFPHMAFYRMFL